MSKTNSLHYDLCCLGARWLRNRRRCKYVAVEICTMGDNVDVFGIRYGYESFNIEVKTSHSDFIADQKKWIRQAGSEYLRAGNYRYYLCPEGVIKEEELPEGWGLLYYNEEYSNKVFPLKVKVVCEPKCFDVTYKSELFILQSIMAREGIKPQIFNYRGQNNTIKPKTIC